MRRQTDTVCSTETSAKRRSKKETSRSTGEHTTNVKGGGR